MRPGRVKISPLASVQDSVPNRREGRESFVRPLPNIQLIISILISCRFPKPKDEGWFLLLGDVETHELLALKRIGGLKTGTTNNQQLTFTTPSFNTPEIMGHNIGGFKDTKRVILTLYIMSDAYIGLDQQYDLRLEIADSPTNNLNE